MTRALLAIMFATVGCAGHAACPDGGAACGAACTIALSGNVSDDLESPACAQLSASTLAFTLAPPSLGGGTLAISIELAAPAVGSYGPSSVTSWSAQGVRLLDGGQCGIVAGAGATPAGDFALDLTELAPPHGHLTLDAAIESPPATVCGVGDTEEIRVSF